MKENTKNLIIGIMLLLFAGLLGGFVHTAYVNRVNTIVETINGPYDSYSLSINELDVNAQKYTVIVNYITLKNGKTLTEVYIEKDVKNLLSKKSINEITDSDVQEIVEFYKNNGIIITTFLINGRKDD